MEGEWIMSLEELLQKRNATEKSFEVTITGITNRSIRMDSSYCWECDCDCNCRCDCNDGW